MINDADILAKSLDLDLSIKKLKYYKKQYFL